MADSIVRWKPGKTGLYESYEIRKEDWERMGFSDDDAAPLVFDRSNNFAVIGDKLPFVQMEFLESDNEFEIKRNPASTVVTQSMAATVAGAVTSNSQPGSKPVAVDLDPEGTAAAAAATEETTKDSESTEVKKASGEIARDNPDVEAKLKELNEPAKASAKAGKAT